MTTPKKIMIVAGEDSGDAHAASLVRSLREQLVGCDIQFFGATGSQMRREGVETVVKSDDFGIFGVMEVVRAVPMFLKVMNRLVAAAAEYEPDAVVLVDFPEFNLKLAKKLKKKGFRIIYYISPQLWAWRGYRIRGIRKYVDLLLTILPFEDGWYREHGVDHSHFVGNPLAGTVSAAKDKSDFCEANSLDSGLPIVALLPGSRGREIEQNLPVMLAAASDLKSSRDDLQFACALASSRNPAKARALIESVLGPECDWMKLIQDDTYSVLNAADAAAVASGTATLEAAIIGTPQVIVYRTSNLNYLLLRPLVSIDTFGLANLIAGRQVYRELIQDDFTPQALSAELIRLLEPGVNLDLRAKGKEIRKSLGTSDASANAAEAIIFFNRWSPAQGQAE